MSREEVINRIKWFLDEADCTPTYQDMQEILALLEAEPREPKDELRTTIDMLMDAEEQTRIGINPNDVEHARSPAQILCRILGEYDKQRQEIARLNTDSAAMVAAISDFTANMILLGYLSLEQVKKALGVDT